MKKKFHTPGAVRLALLVMLAALLPLMNSCKKEPTDISGILATVPSSASAVVGVDLRSVLEKAGCKVEGSNISAGKEVAAWLARGKGMNASEAATLRILLNGDNGIDPLGAVAFTDAYNGYVTALLADTDKFKAFAEKQTGETFQTVDGDVATCGNIAVCGAQMWVCFTSHNTIDPKAVKNYSALDKQQSFLSMDASRNIAAMETDIAGWADLSLIMKGGLGFSRVAQFNLIAGALFENPRSVEFSVEFDKGELRGSTVILNDKGERAKYLLPASKLDLATVKGLGGTSQALVAVCITKDLTKKLDKFATSLGGMMFSEVLTAMKPVDGTVAFALGSVDSAGDLVNGVVTTDGNPTPELMNFLSQIGSTRKDGKLVGVAKGTVKGALRVEDAADYLKGATMGGVADARLLTGDSTGFVTTAALALLPEGNGIKTTLTLVAHDSKKNFLLQYVENN